ncbi:ABC transporter substrate-binding protein [Amycolatopsis sp. YIM 10]|uniref:ABC transporter substrate-binding protein n=1 Tax=Amycolatopsis sp. YIM 10 TaxID=2653857 RepID=UPI00128FF9E0|nr:ABC transporter substrate-binding protein [Amycolatopsis sp. YIM 10]QFU92315.1 Putative binding protein YgiS precursor [Amycolatopsis sp. YIM 10]
MRLISVLLLAAVLTACTPAPEPPAPDVLTVGVTEPGSLVPAEVRDQAGRTVVSALWTPIPAEAATSPDLLTWTVKPPTGRFHDGTPVTAKSYVDTWRLTGGSLGAREITAVDESTVRIVLEHPSGEIPVKLTAPAFLPLPESVLASGDWNGFSRHPIGNGPYRMAAPWEPGKGAKLTRITPESGKPREIELRAGAPGTHYDEVKAGTLDLATEVPGDRHEAMHTDFADRHAMWPLPSAGYLVFPLGDKRFEDAAVRFAFAMAIDRAAVAKGPLGDQADPAKGALPGDRSATCRPCSHDPAAAKALASQGGFSGEVNLYFAPGEEAWARALAEQVQAALSVPVHAKPRPEGTLDGPLAITVQAATPGEAVTALTAATAYAGAGFGDLVAAASSATGEEERAQRYRLVENQLLRDLPAAPIWTGHGHAVWSPRVRGATALPFRGIELTNITVAN